ncbi:MAG: hypothetical protein LC804_10560 [Acidobacteria bacterium]|nr:hypothetical protein [Acidobacteriota bacterium]
MSSLIERRSAPRVVLQFEEAVGIELRHRARFMDISLNGALLACDVKLPAGTHAKLRAGFASPCVADIVIRRHDDRPQQHGTFGLGAVLVSMDDRSRRSLEQFLRKASE